MSLTVHLCQPWTAWQPFHDGLEKQMSMSYLIQGLPHVRRHGPQASFIKAQRPTVSCTALVQHRCRCVQKSLTNSARRAKPHIWNHAPRKIGRWAQPWSATFDCPVLQAVSGQPVRLQLKRRNGGTQFLYLAADLHLVYSFGDDFCPAGLLFPRNPSK